MGEGNCGLRNANCGISIVEVHGMCCRRRAFAVALLLTERNRRDEKSPFGFRLLLLVISTDLRSRLLVLMLPELPAPDSLRMYTCMPTRSARIFFSPPADEWKTSRPGSRSVPSSGG